MASVEYSTSVRHHTRINHTSISVGLNTRQKAKCKILKSMMDKILNLTVGRWIHQLINFWYTRSTWIWKISWSDGSPLGQWHNLIEMIRSNQVARVKCVWWIHWCSNKNYRKQEWLDKPSVNSNSQQSIRLLICYKEYQTGNRMPFHKSEA